MALMKAKISNSLGRKKHRFLIPTPLTPAPLPVPFYPQNLHIKASARLFLLPAHSSPSYYYHLILLLRTSLHTLKIYT